MMLFSWLSGSWHYVVPCDLKCGFYCKLLWRFKIIHLFCSQNLSSYGHYKHYPDVTQVERLYLESRNEDPQQMLKGSVDRNSHTVLPTLHTYR
jgi:hypothetical protein